VNASTHSTPEARKVEMTTSGLRRSSLSGRRRRRGEAAY
jgi:hypothetical protein